MIAINSNKEPVVVDCSQVSNPSYLSFDRPKSLLELVDQYLASTPNKWVAWNHRTILVNNIATPFFVYKGQPKRSIRGGSGKTWQCIWDHSRPLQVA